MRQLFATVVVAVLAVSCGKDTTHAPETMLLAEDGYNALSIYAASTKLVYMNYKQSCTLAVTWKDGSMTEVPVAESVCVAAARYVIKMREEQRLVDKISDGVQPNLGVTGTIVWNEDLGNLVMACPCPQAWITDTPSDAVKPKAKGR